MPKVIPKVEDSKRTNQQELTAKQYAKYPTVNIDECIEKLRKEPDFRKNMFMMDVNACIITNKGSSRYNQSHHSNRHVDDEINKIYKLSNICGAFIYDSFIPGVTTHIISNYPDKQILGKAGSLDNSASPFVVTTQWLSDSVISGKKEDEKLYLPPDIHLLNNSCSIQQQTITKKTQNKFGTTFKGLCFSIISDSYSQDDIDEIVDKVESNGGSIISEQIENSCAKYMIMNDGYENWKGFNLTKNQHGKYTISHRFLDRCLSHKEIVRLEKEKAMDLLPLPYKAPYEGFSKYCVAFTMFDNGK